MTKVKGGAHLGAVREWIKWHRGSLGSSVTWSSDVSLGTVTVRELEEISQWVKDAAVREHKEKLESLLVKAKRGIEYGPEDYADTNLKFRFIASDLEKMIEEMEEEND